MVCLRLEGNLVTVIVIITCLCLSVLLGSSWEHYHVIITCLCLPVLLGSSWEHYHVIVTCLRLPLLLGSSWEHYHALLKSTCDVLTIGSLVVRLFCVTSQVRELSEIECFLFHICIQNITRSILCSTIVRAFGGMYVNYFVLLLLFIFYKTVKKIK